MSDPEAVEEIQVAAFVLVVAQPGPLTALHTEKYVQLYGEMLILQ
jgi:hypothetical protein